MLTCDILRIPFSKSGTFLKITGITPSKSGRVMIATARKIPFIDFATKSPPTDYYEIALLKGEREVKYRAHSSPWQLTLDAAQGSATFAFMDDDTLLFSTRGLSVRFLPCHSLCTLTLHGDRGCDMVDYRGLCTHLARSGSGATLAVTKSTTVAGETGPYHDTPYTLTFRGRDGANGALRFDRFGQLWHGALPSMAVTLKERRREWESWLQRMPPVPQRLTEAAQEAWYVLWNCTARAEGLYTRRPILMSKNWMNQVWSWDNCFNALAVAGADPQLAFDQLLLFFDRQSPSGMLPEPLSDSMDHYGYVKPPIYGWTIARLVTRLGRKACLHFVRHAYAPVANTTRWWYTERDNDCDGMCEYHHGNDSGWDNAAIFDQGYPTEGADLAAHLVMQMEGLALMADMLGRKPDAARWRAMAGQQLAVLLKQGVKRNRFFSPLNHRRDAKERECLLNYIPMILGRRLPATVRAALVSDLSEGGPFLTQHGLATQSPESRKYTPNGYWRGPIWAPSTYLIFDGLVDAGETALAGTIAERFCMMCARSPGMWENYDAQSGKGLCCPGYSWTAAVFILLAQWLREQE
jgi:hypothetical protein